MKLLLLVQLWLTATLYNLVGIRAQYYSQPSGHMYMTDVFGNSNVRNQTIHDLGKPF